MTEPMLCQLFGVACDTGMRSSLVDFLTLLGISYCVWAASGFQVGDGSSSDWDCDGD